ncbi:MAG: MBL fold metallo-hydrolase [Syntrophales bacterium LBB04]|nr:MBL fold metallo-hydrolase [Syntrophales bacterium LBB04]
MKVIALEKKSDSIYSCISYLVLGSWNRLNDVNTLIDVGTDGTITEEIEVMNTGVGKKQVDQVILTHNHFDHSAGLPAIIEKFSPRVYAFTPGPYVTHLLTDGQLLAIGDRYFQVMHCPIHSDDSICLYCEEEGVLFSGDTQLIVRHPGGTYSEIFVELLKRLSRLHITAIYPGHDHPITKKVKERIYETLSNVTKSNAA